MLLNLLRHKCISVCLLVWLLLGGIASAENVQPRIVGGKPAEPGAYPWMVALLFSNVESDFSAQFCAGTLVHPEWVLTAAHCVAELRPESLDLLIGQVSLDAADNERVRAAGIFVHPDYIATIRQGPDIALVQLPFTNNATQQNILPFSNIAPEAGVAANILGWGMLMEEGGFPFDLYEATVHVSTAQACLSAYGNLGPDFFCAGESEGGIDTCNGDSGGPLIVADTGTGAWRQVGITSSGIGCARPGFPGVYSNVANQVSWLNSTIAENSSDPGTQSDIQMAVAFPHENASIQGTMSITGWSVSSVGISHMELHVDNQFYSFIPYGGRRSDILSLYPTYSDALYSAFALSFYSKQFSEGAHTLSVIAVDNAGRSIRQDIQVTTTKLSDKFLTSGQVNTNAATLSSDGNVFHLNNVIIDGKAYNLTFGWENSMQSMRIIAVDSLH